MTKCISCNSVETFDSCFEQGIMTAICERCYDNCLNPKTIQDWNRRAKNIPNRFSYQPPLIEIARGLGWDRVLTAEQVFRHIENNYPFERSKIHSILFELAEAGYLVYNSQQKPDFEPNWTTEYKIVKLE